MCGQGQEALDRGRPCPPPGRCVFMSGGVYASVGLRGPLASGLPWKLSGAGGGREGERRGDGQMGGTAYGEGL